jgi:NADH dehydrogenase [ubiquinone] 1 alpha subcomplex assembly factor 7
VHDLHGVGPTIVLGNEYLDTRGVMQYIVSDGRVYERTVELDAIDRFVFGHKVKPEVHDIEWSKREFGDLKDGTILETQPNYQPTEALRQIAKAGPMAALFIDYGQTGVPNISLGDTLQAVRQHKYEHVFTSPGEADLTAQVNFTEVAQNALDAGLSVDGPITQAEFLGRLGIVERASKLMAANPARAGEIEAGVMRLMAPNGMGTRFKAIGIRSPGLPTLPGFEG